ncbi:mycothiol synthase [Propionicimonas sp.]|uniref:mycothiol synthase n=1 Tax=Propionicimonas sp. TaxID=1955623 RepID=UPI0039E2557F
MWTNRLTATQAQQVLALAGRAAAADGTPPLNEEAHFALGDASAGHLLDHDDEPRGYLQWHPGYRTAQLVVDPAHRGHGIGRGLLGRLAADHGHDWAVWAFGDLPPAQGLASALGLAPRRGLLIMERGLAGVEPPAVPDGLTLRGYTDADADALLAVNAAAFAHHPEQGALDAHGLAARTAEPWFDPDGLILGVDAEGLAGFHWTKRQDAGTGEVYVVGVAPRAQGRGYGTVLLQAGLAHLRSRGADHVLLYVDMAEPVAVRMYESAGFRVAHRDVLYAPEHGSVQKQEQP